MDFFSWLTADTQESIWNIFQTHSPCRKVYLLQPDKEPLMEPEYNGYGDFADIDAYEWIANYNCSEEEKERWLLEGKTLRDLGLKICIEEFERERPPLKYPLKFSFSKNADYNSLPASKICPNRGYFALDD